MSIKRIHFSATDAWDYKIGYRYVRITSPQRKSVAVPLGELADPGYDGGYVPPSWVRRYIQKHLRYKNRCIIPEHGASVLLKRALLKLCPILNIS